jgi:hypothetical protein
MQWDYPDWRSLAIYRSALKVVQAPNFLHWITAKDPMRLVAG